MRNRYGSLGFCVTSILIAALAASAQSGNPGPLPPAASVQSSSPNTPQPAIVASAADVPASAGTDNSVVPDAPSATSSEASTADPAASPVMKRDFRGAPPAAQGGPLWVDRSVADRNYLLVNSGMFGASILNAELTMRCLNKHPSCNDVPPSLQSRTAIYGIGIPADLAVSYLTYCLKRKHVHMWYAPAAAVAGGNVFLGMRAHHWTEQ